MPEQEQHGAKEVETFLLNVNPLKRKLNALATTQGMKVNENVYEYLLFHFSLLIAICYLFSLFSSLSIRIYMNMAVSERLRSIMETLVRVSDHRLETHKDDLSYTITSEPRKASFLTFRPFLLS